MVLFLLLSLFAIIQVAWWVIFQIQVSGREEAGQQRVWQQQIETAMHYVHDHHENISSLEAWLDRTFPDLRIDSGGAGIIVRESAKERLRQRTHNTRNMFIHEGIVFTLLLLAGIYYLYRTLRKEVAIERQQANFLAAISHELKTPITALRLYLDTLIDRKLPEESVNELQYSMRENLDRLQTLIERLLQARAMIGVGDRRTHAVIDLREATKQVVDGFETEKNVRGQFDLQFSGGSHPLYVRIDPELWRQLLLNLLDNAVKYSSGEARVHVQLTSSKRAAILTVEDQGIGFDPAERKRIFSRFYRIGNEDTRRSEGSGIGLYLVHEIARQHGGKAFAHSRGVGEGATFTVEVPRVKEKNAA